MAVGEEGHGRAIFKLGAPQAERFPGKFGSSINKILIMPSRHALFPLLHAGQEDTPLTPAFAPRAWVLPSPSPALALP